MTLALRRLREGCFFFEWVKPFYNILKYKSATPGAFAEIMEVANHVKQWDVELAYYSLSAYSPDWPLRLKARFWDPHFRPTWPRLIIEFLATWAKFFQPFGFCTEISFNHFVTVLKLFQPFGYCTEFFQLSGYCTKINFAFSFHITHIFDWFHCGPFRTRKA